MTARDRKLHKPETERSRERARKTRVQEGDPHACWDETETDSGKSPEQQRRDSKLEAGRPKDTGRCG